MAPRMRAAYEKVRTPLLTVRRGRDPDLPVSLYQELDEITRRVDGLVLLQGTNAEAIAKLLKSEDPLVAVNATKPASTVPTTGTVPSSTRFRQTVYFAESTSGTNVSTPYVLIPSVFDILKFSFVLSATVSARVHVDYKSISQSAGNDIAKTALSLQFTAGVPRTVTPFMLGFADVPGPTGATDRRFEEGSIRLRVSGASGACVLSGTMIADLIQTVGGS